jgi:type IV fimbrial biogenesis protein FimT
MRRAGRASGFTMLEMAITMTIFAILVVLGVPSMSSWIKNNKVRAVTDSLQTALRLAQAESLRRSRQVVFALTDSNTPTALLPLPAAANGKSWVIYTVPSMTDGTEAPDFIQSGDFSNASANVQIDSHGVAAVCFNSIGRVVGNAGANVAAITGTACIQPSGAPALQIFNVSLAGADRPLQVNLSLGGQVHMCDPAFALSSAHPEGC